MHITDISGTATLSNGVEMPCLGLGVFLANEGREVVNAVQWALEEGYRHVDTAAYYENERGVGRAIRASGLPREEVFVTTKVWNTDQGYNQTIRAFDASLHRLQMDYVDLYLVHWPVVGEYKDTWRALEQIYRDGRARAIGVSNFMMDHLEDLLSHCEIRPMVNQVEFHPFLVQQPLLDYCKAKEIQHESWFPFMHGRLFELGILTDLCDKYNKTVAQIVLRWNLQKGVIVIPKSVHRERIVENSRIFDFALGDQDMRYIDNLDRGQRFGSDPYDFHF